MDTNWRVIIIVCCSVVGGLSCWFSATAIQSNLDDYSDFELQTLTAVVQLGFVIGTLTSFLCRLPERFNPKLIFATGSIVAGICNLTTLTDIKPIVFPCRCLIGVCMTCIYPIGIKIVSEFSTLEDRHLANASVVAGLVVGIGLPYLVVAFGVSNAVLIYATSLFSLTSALLISLVPAENLKTLPNEAISLSHVFDLWKNEELVLVLFAYFFHNWELFTVWKFIHQFYEEAVFPDSKLEAGVGAFLFFLIGSSGCLLGSYMTKYYKTTGSIILINFVSSICDLLVGWVTDTPTTCFICAIWSISLIADSALYSSCITIIAPDLKGTAVTMQVSIGFLTTIPPMYIVPAVLDRFDDSWGYGFWVAVPGAIIAFWCALKLNVGGFDARIHKNEEEQAI